MELKKHQPALNIEQQVENLKAKGLLIEDDDMEKSFLNEVSYFRLIKAYSLRLKEKNSNYHENVSFNQLVELYLFNQRFRELLFPQIEKIEITLRAILMQRNTQWAFLNLGKNTFIRISLYCSFL